MLNYPSYICYLLQIGLQQRQVRLTNTKMFSQGTWGTWLKARHRTYHWLICSINVLPWGITSIRQHYLCVSLLLVAQSCLECSRYVPPALCLVLVDLFLTSNLCMLRRWCCWVRKAVEKGRKSIKIDEFPTFKKAGNPLFCCKNGLSGSNPVKNRALLVWRNRLTSKMNTNPT